MRDTSIAEIERSLHAERLALDETLGRLRERVAPAALIADGKALLRAQVAPLAERVDAELRGRSFAASVARVAMTVAGLRPRHQPGPSATFEPRREAMARWEDDGGPPAMETASVQEAWLDEAVGLRSSARSMLARIDVAARRKLAPAGELAAHRTATLRAFAQGLSAALGRGLETVAEPARAAALRERERLYVARVAMADRARHAVDEHPLATGLALAAAGAAVACLFRQTDTEQRVLGPVRDRLFAEAGQRLRKEATQASDLAATLAQAFESDLGRIAALFTERHEAAAGVSGKVSFH
jgi:hypothetical protein